MSYYMEIDLHNQTVESARKFLTQKLKTLPKDVGEVNIIHGYHSGTALKKMVQNYKNPAIKQKILGLNQGTTVFVINKK